MTRPQTTQPLWSPYEVAAATGGTLCVHGPDGVEDGEGRADGWSASGLSFDTRSLRRGDIFVALTAARDGHEFLGAAAEAGAAAALVSHVPADAPTHLPLIRVTDTLEALRRLAVAARERNFGKLVAITGSAGKTSTKEIMRAALSGLGSVHAANRSFNNHIGVPLTLAELPARADFGVFEIGMNHAGEITPLVDLVRPHVAIVTTVAAAHLENFESIEGIAYAKAEILSGVREGGAAVLPADNEYYDLLVREARRHGIERLIPFGETEAADAGVRLVDWREEGDHAAVTIAAGGERHSFAFHGAGRHQAVNAAAVIGAAMALDLPLREVVERLSSFRPGGGRGATHGITVRGSRVRVIDESYNANPASMNAALSVLASAPVGPSGRRIAVLGEMRELGPDSPAMHAGLAGPIRGAGVTQVFLAGPMMAHLEDALPGEVGVEHAARADDLLDALTSSVRDGDTILFKGSNASGIQDLLGEFLKRADRAD
jgi:UDP-N-acetylmuramoyl-tripeptide--D-alanyl-D-alanine ligase